MSDLEIDQVLPEGSNEVFPCPFRKVGKNILLDADELVAFRLQIQNNVALVRAYFVPQLYKQRRLARALTADYQVHLAATGTVKLIGIQIVKT